MSTPDASMRRMHLVVVALLVVSATQISPSGDTATAEQRSKPASIARPPFPLDALKPSPAIRST
ncbi:MAG: hypothetical protein AAFX94_00200, partial [Myxococcota bacterium]